MALFVEVVGTYGHIPVTGFVIVG